MLIGAYLLLPFLNSIIKEYDLEGLGYILILWFLFIVILKDLKIDFFTQIVSAHSLSWTGIFQVILIISHWDIINLLKNSSFGQADVSYWFGYVDCIHINQYSLYFD